MASICSRNRSFCPLVGVALLPVVALGEVPNVLDLRCPARGVSTLRLSWELESLQEPAMLGDVDADGFDDFLLGDGEAQQAPGAILIYGIRDLPDRMDPGSLRHTRFVSNAAALTGPPEAYAAAGDLDGDGYADLLLGYWKADVAGSENSGFTLVVFGSATLPSTISPVDLGAQGVRAVRLIGVAPEAFSGWAVERAGDLNGDGHQDLAVSSIGAEGTENRQRYGGCVHVVFGPFSAGQDIHLSDLGRSAPGFALQGSFGHSQGGHNNGDWLGSALAGTGDLNGDGFDDLVVGARSVTRGNSSESGSLSVVFGRAEFPAELSMDSPGQYGAFILGLKSSGYLGTSVASLGDFDGDGLVDFAAGSPGATSPGYSGEVVIVHGSHGWPAQADLADARLETTLISSTLPSFIARLPGIDGNSFLGASVAGAGDWNGDSFPDLVIGAPRQNVRFAPQVGAAYVVFGGTRLPPTILDSDVGTPSAHGLRILGDGEFPWLGIAVAGGGDIDGDRGPDLLLVSDNLEVSSPNVLSVLHGEPELVHALRLCAVAPASGSRLGGIRVELLGGGFTGAETITFGEATATEVNAYSTAQLSVVVPPSPTVGKVDLRVSRAGKSALLPQGFEYFEPTGYEDVVLTPNGLAQAGYRALELREAMPVPRRFLSRGFAGCYFHDLNADGVEDLVVASMFDGERSQGSVTIVFGGRGLPSKLEWPELGTHGTVITGDPGLVRFGLSVAFPRDISGDGLPDLAIGGAVTAEGSRTGWGYVLYGRRIWEPALDIVEEVRAGRAVAIPNEPCGFPFFAAPGPIEVGGRQALVMGQSHCQGVNSRVQIFLDEFPMAGGPAPAPVIITGNDPDMVFGNAVSQAGDVNGDQIADVLIGSYGPVGSVHVVLGGEWSFREAGINELVELGRAVHIPERGSGSLGSFGLHLQSAGDFNGDSLADSVIGNAASSNWKGASFLVLGSTELGTTRREIDLDAPASPVVRIIGESPEDRAVYAADVGDLNSDGYSDLGIVPACLFNQVPRAYVLFGEPDPPPQIDLEAMGPRGFRLIGDPQHWFSSLHGPIAAGDLDGDSRQDLAIGEMTPGGKRVLVLFGRAAEDSAFVRGETNGDGTVNLADAVFVLQHLFAGGPRPTCLDSADTDDTGTLDLSDAVYLLRYLFLGGMAPPRPYPDQGVDPTEDGLGC